MQPVVPEPVVLEGLGRMPGARYDSATVRVVVGSSGGDPMSRDTLRGVGGSSEPPTDPAEAPDGEQPRLRQVEFTVPPEIWRRPPSGWFRQFVRAAPAAPPADEPGPKASEPDAALDGAMGLGAALPTSRPRRWLPLAFVAAVVLALLAGWRLFGARAAPAAGPAPSLAFPSSVAPAVAERSATPMVPTSSVAPPSSVAPAVSTVTASPKLPPVGARTSTPAPSASVPIPPSSTNGPIY